MVKQVRKLTQAERYFLADARDESSLMYRPAKDMFRIGLSCSDTTVAKWCVWMYNILMAECDTQQEAIQTRTELYNS